MHSFVWLLTSRKVGSESTYCGNCLLPQTLLVTSPLQRHHVRPVFLGSLSQSRHAQQLETTQLIRAMMRIFSVEDGR